MSRPGHDFTKCHPGVLSHEMGVFGSRRSSVMGLRGMASSSQPLASQAGIAILELGGNAADAAVAIAAALAVVEPCSNGIGGDSFCLFWDEAGKKVRGINASGRSPAKATLAALQKGGLREGSEIPPDNPHSVTVPGAVAGWVDTVEKFGSGKVTLSQVLAPAIRLAENGYPVHETVGASWQRTEATLQRSSNGTELLLPSGKAPRVGDVIRLPQMARTIREVATKGKDGFYKGRVAEAIVRVLKEQGGLMELDDLAHHAEVGSEEVEPISYEFGATKAEGGNGVTLHECPPNGQGIVALIALGVLDSLQRSGKSPDVSIMDHNSAEYLHLLIFALRVGFADAHQYVTDPAHGGSERVKGMLSRPYLDERAKLFDPKKATPIKYGNPQNSSGTVYLTASDKDGNACSFIQSTYMGFGSCIVPKDCGFSLQNRGCNFKLEKDHPNCIAPRKRPYHTIIPAMATKMGSEGPELLMAYGVMGGYMQPQGHVQVLLNVLRGYTAQAALDAPRFCIGAGMPDSGDVMAGVHFEEGIKPKVVEELREMGHKGELITSWQSRGQFGRGQIIMTIDGSANKRVWAGGSDPRADGQTIAQV